MQEDIDAIWEDDGGRAGRFLNKSKLYPVVHVLERGSLKQKRALGNVYFKRVMEPSDLEAVRAVLEDAGAREYCATRAAAMRDEALANLEGAGIDNDAKARWHEIAHSLV
jgi:geranylgeranyl pyrophosphate synthase